MARPALEATFQEILTKLQKTKKVRSAGGIESWEACCPAHNDSNPSLICTRTHQKILFYCRAGCEFKQIVTALGLGPSGLFGDSQAQPGYSLARLEIDKRLPYDFLTTTCRLQKGERTERGTTIPFVGIPYYDRQGNEQFIKQRRSLNGSGSDKFYIPKGHSNTLYGTWRLDEFLPGEVLHIVEGESDLWTLWYHNIPAISVPGANGSDLVSPITVKGFKRIYIWKDSDQAGANFVRKLAERIDSFMMGIEVMVIYHPDHKDPSALHIKDPSKFPKAWQEVIATAVPPGSVPPPPDATPTLFPSSGEPRISPWGIPIRHMVFGQMGYEWNRIAARCACLYRDMLRFDRKGGEWFRYTGTRWEASTSKGFARDFLYTTIDGLQEEAQTIQGDNDDDRRARTLVGNVRRRLLQDNTVFRIIEQLACEREIAANRNDFDQQHQLINFPNGTFDLNTNQLRPHTPDDLITHVMGTCYDAIAKCPTFLRFLNRLLGDDQDMIAYLQQAAGYTLTGFTREHCLFFLYGLGGNGKGTFMKVMLACMGSYATQIKAETIVNTSSEKSYYDIADLPGIRLAVCTELPQDRGINESLIKEMVSEDRLKARHLFERFFAFDPSHKLWISGNHKPTIRGNDNGMWRRIRLLNMNAKISESERDPQLFSKLLSELPGICNWLIQGAVHWYSTGKLMTPPRVQTDTAEYMEDCDPIVDFLEECAITDPMADTKKIHLYMAYTDWCFRIGDRRPMGKTTFLRNIEERGYQCKRKNNVRVITGIRLLDEPQFRRRPGSQSNNNWELGVD